MAVHALESSSEYDEGVESECRPSPYSVIREGSQLLCKGLGDWFDYGAWRPESVAGVAAASPMYRLAANLRIPLIFCSS